MDQIKLAFQKAKEDITFLQQEVYTLKERVSSFNLLFNNINSQLSLLNKKIDSLSNSLSLIISSLNFNQKENIYPNLNTKNYYNSNSFIKDLSSTKNPTHLQQNPTHLQQTPCFNTNITNKNNLFKPQKAYFYNISTGNKGVPTDRQTNQQTDRQIQKIKESLIFENSNSPNETFSLNKNNSQPSLILKNLSSLNQDLLRNSEKQTQNKKEDFFKEDKDQFKEALNVLTSLDSLKKEIKQKFKRLTEQEFLVFSTIYQLEEENKQINYKILSSILNLTESSIRDYVGRLLIKNVPLIKEKVNNKTIKLSISPEFKKLIPLNILINLRGS
jgi:hypothetical protein